MTTATPDTIERTDIAEELGIVFATQNPSTVIVWDDPVNLMSYVEFVFRKHFGYSKEKSHKLMLAVHNDGKAAVWSGDKETAEQHVSTMHNYGLQSTIEKAG